MRYQGKALFLDSDMIVRDDIHDLFDLQDDSPLMVVKSKNRFEWPSLMLFDCEKCQKLTPEYIDSENTKPQSFEWADKVGKLPNEWNYCVGYDETDIKPALIHYTRGIPFFKECRNEQFSKEWWEEYDAMTYTVSWMELMGKSVHAEGIMKELKTMNDFEYIA